MTKNHLSDLTCRSHKFLKTQILVILSRNVKKESRLFYYRYLQFSAMNLGTQNYMYLQQSGKYQSRIFMRYSIYI